MSNFLSISWREYILLQVKYKQLRQKLLVKVTFASRWKTSSAVTKKQKTTIKIRKPRPTAGKALLIYKMETHRREYPLLPCVAVFLGMAAGIATAILRLWGKLRLRPVDSQEERWKRPEPLILALNVWSGQPWSSSPLFRWDNVFFIA